MFRGVKNYKDVGRVISVNGDTGKMMRLIFLLIITIGKINKVDKISTKLFDSFYPIGSSYIFLESNVWDDEECNRYIGTDTTIVPPLLVPEEGMSSSSY